LNGAPKDLPIRLALLFNDAETAKQALSRLRYDGGTAHAAAQLVQYKDAGIPPERKHVRRWLNKLGEERLRQWAAMKRADAIPPLIDEIIERRLCFTLKDLAANGTDLLGAGIPEGTQIGAILNRLLDKVMDEEIENDKAALMKAARTM
jgi:tRNA nucleotidyltransferase (CCA-adding enzyme)